MRECDGVDIEIVLVLLFVVIKYYVPVKNKYKYIFDIKYFWFPVARPTTSQDIGKIHQWFTLSSLAKNDK